jgi:hypothetical protein
MAADPPIRFCTIVLMAIAFANCEVAAHLDGIPSIFGIAFGGGLLIVTVVVGRLVRNPHPGERHPPARWIVPLVAPIAIDFVGRWLAKAELPLELQLVNGLRILGLGLAALAAWPSCRKLAGITALFLAVFAAAMGDQAAMPYLLATFAIVGGIWLLMEHRAESPNRSAERVKPVARVGLRVPVREAIVFSMLALAAGGVAWAGPERVRIRLGEWLPTSGGSGDIDLRARSGMGDGPEETAGDQPRAAGMVEADTLIEDSNDSLLDAASDTYGPPHPPPKNQERTAAADFLRVRQNHGPTPLNRTPSRPFKTSRRGAETGARPLSRNGRGLYEVEGRAPLHIRIRAFDQYDAAGAEWLPAPKPSRRTHSEDSDGWMRLPPDRDDQPLIGDRETHRIKVADAPDSIVPTPVLLERFRIQRVTNRDHFESSCEGVFVFAGRTKLPAGVVVQTESWALAPELLHASAISELRVPASRTWPEPLRNELAGLARSWAGDQLRGWAQIEAIRSKLASEYTLDRSASAPASCPAPVLWFLNESKRGPDYLFATAAALLLQSLDYPVRFCLGYYAAPDAFDPETEHTPVRVTDLHAWCEVLLADGRWLVVEATPGYEILRPAPSLLERTLSIVTAIGHWCRDHAWLCSGFTVAILGVLRFRHAIRDQFLLLAWKLSPGRTWQETVLRTLRVLQGRSRRAGLVSMPVRTLRQWAAGLDITSDEFREVVRLGEWAAYGPVDAVLDHDRIRKLCGAVLSTETLSRFRRRLQEGKKS